MAGPALLTALAGFMFLALIWAPESSLAGDLRSALERYDIYVNLFWTVVAAVVFYIGARLVVRYLSSGDLDLQTRYRLRKVVVRTASFLYVGVLILIWSKRIENLAVLLGIVGAGIAVSVQEPLLCLVAWVFILVKKPYDIGDRVQLGGSAGDVIDIGLFQTTMLEIGNWVHADQSTGRILMLPNSRVFRSDCYNYTAGFPFIWNEIVTVVTFESDWRRAKQILLSLAQEEADAISSEVQRRIAEMQGKYAIQFRQFTPIVYTHIAPEGVGLTLRYLTPVRNRRGMSNKICEGVLDAFLKDGIIDFAYPTTRFFDNKSEGKSPFPHAAPPAGPQGAE